MMRIRNYLRRTSPPTYLYIMRQEDIRASNRGALRRWSEGPLPEAIIHRAVCAQLDVRQESSFVSRESMPRQFEAMDRALRTALEGLSRS